MAKRKKKWTAAEKKAFARRMKAARLKKAGGGPSKKRKPAKRKVSKKRTRTVVIKKEVTKVARKKRRAPVAKKKGSRRRRSGFSFGDRKNVFNTLQNAGLAIGGGVTAAAIANKLPVQQQFIKASFPVGLGLALLMFGGRRIPYAIPLGMVGVGGLSLIRTQFPNIPLLAGEEELVVTPQIDYNRSNGYPSSMQGVEEIELGDVPEEEYVTSANM